MQEWFVLFGDGFSMPRPWWYRFLAPGYRHVIAMRGNGVGWSTIIIEHVGSRMIVDVRPDPVDEVVLWYMQHNRITHALKVRVPNPDDAPPVALLRPPMTCVEAVKAVLGLSAPRIIFPRQLAHRLRAMGAWEVPTLSLSDAA
ncbi:hypothetical protein GXW78_16905 [Roseomonas terrae]|uniref:Uncharacterized protein n=1 Tax=Neoroseomonas terrae TaxID=424799 RepID=A0ABS5EK09_9PROT|nr:hypothetical protein [Neoroseomonas terrae]MBR0651355.1 hypothetical protein [Neoroseomonas terrae]